MNEWISVKERLPEKVGVYLVCYGDGPYAGKIDIAIFTDTWHKAYSISHWMPLPEPPKEVNHERSDQ